MSDTDELGLGKDILSLCGKCKMAMGHLIVSIDEKGRIDKCECQTCGATHKYKDPEGKKATKKSTKPSTRKAAVSIEQRWADAKAKATGNAKNYKMSDPFQAGDLINHSTFGMGVVLELVGNNKIKMIFECGEKDLACNRQ